MIVGFVPLTLHNRDKCLRVVDWWGHPHTPQMVDPYTWPWSPNSHRHGHEWPTATPFVQCQLILPFWDTAISKFDHENPWSRSCVWLKVKVTFDHQNSKVKVKPIGHIWGLEFNRYVCFSFRGNRSTFGWDIGNSIFDLETSRSRSWPRSNLMVTFEALEFNRYVCFSFLGNRTFFGWDIANSIFDLEKSRSRSRQKSTKIYSGNLQVRANNRAKNEINPKCCSKVIAWTRICGRRRRRTNRYKNIKSPPVYRGDLKMHLKMSSGKWRPFCLSLNVLITEGQHFRYEWRHGKKF